VRAALLAEWTKFHTVRGTAWLPLISVGSFIGLSAVVVLLATPGTTACATGCEASRLSLTGVYSGQIALVVLAVLLVTSEYETGLIVYTFAAVPARLTVLLAKAVVLVLVVLPAAVVSGAGAGLTGGSTAGTVLYLVLVALLGLGLAAAIRHTAPALTAVLALLYLAPLLALVVPGLRIERYAPMPAGLTLSWRGFAVLGGYTALALTLGAIRFRR
jgi:ABC-2 type transport system permease protein